MARNLQLDLEAYYKQLKPETIDKIKENSEQISKDLEEKTVQLAELKMKNKHAKNLIESKRNKEGIKNLQDEINSLLLQQRVAIDEACKAQVKVLAQKKTDGEVVMIERR